MLDLFLFWIVFDLGFESRSDGLGMHVGMQVESGKEPPLIVLLSKIMGGGCDTYDDPRRSSKSSASDIRILVLLHFGCFPRFAPAQLKRRFYD